MRVRRANGEFRRERPFPVADVRRRQQSPVRRPVDETSRQWWLEKFYDTFDLTPEGMADRITKSAADRSPPSIISSTGPERLSRVDGDFPGSQEFWFAHRELDLRGAAFNAEGMAVSDAMQGGGYGSRLMGDLIDTSRLIEIDRIKLRAERIGLYVWVKMGFVQQMTHGAR